jgi:hypothetical protein
VDCNQTITDKGNNAMKSKMNASILFLFWVWLALFGVSLAMAEDSKVGLIIPYFEGGDALTKNVPTIFHLQIWRTLRRAPYPNPQKLDFGDGILKWAEFPLTSQSHMAAEELAKSVKLQMSLWGTVFSYGDGVIVQPYLTIPKYDDGRINKPEQWAVSLTFNGRQFLIEADLPQRHYEFAPIVLSKNIVEKYSSPASIVMYHEKSMDNVIGTVGVDFEALRHEGEMVYVDSGGTHGWVYLPDLATQKNEVVDFCGGLIRIMRGDWQGSIDLLNKVVKNPHTPASLKFDGYLLTAYAKSKQGLSGDADFANASTLVPDAKALVIYQVMAELELLKRQLIGAPKGALPLKARKTLEKIRENINVHSYQFEKDDRWLNQVNALLLYK